MEKVKLIGLLIIVMALGVVIAAVVLGTVLHNSNKNEVHASTITQTVDIDCGRVIGRVTEARGLFEGTPSKPCFEFINIPYAVPPVGQLRWKRPILLDGSDKSQCWKGDLKADGKELKMCVQLSHDQSEVIGNEDCLYLSVRTPNMTGKLPVFVWIHGGGLINGFGENVGYAADAEFTTAMDMVTVNINYRLTLLGFLTLQEIWTTAGAKSFANFGFMDQIAALQWVKNNIGRFGGDPESVTIIGESSGATSVFALLASPMANGLFHKAIGTSMSGIFTHDYKAIAKINENRFGRALGCDRGTMSERRACLYGSTAERIVEVTRGIFTMGNFGLPSPDQKHLFLSALDPIVLPNAPLNIKIATFAPPTRIPVMFGNLAEEFPIKNITTWQSLYKDVKKHMDYFNSSYTNTVLKLYSNNTPGEVKSPLEVWAEMAADSMMTCPLNVLSKGFSMSPHYDVHRFYVTHRPSHPVPVFGGLDLSFHTWDTSALFGFKKDDFLNFKPRDHDFEFTRKIREIYKNFIHQGEVPSEWHRYPRSSGYFINREPWFEVKDGEVQAEQCKFWILNGFYKYGMLN